MDSLEDVWGQGKFDLASLVLKKEGTYLGRDVESAVRDVEVSYHEDEEGHDGRTDRREGDFGDTMAIRGVIVNQGPGLEPSGGLSWW